MNQPGIIEVEKTSDTGVGNDFMARVVVLNDDHNTFEGVAGALARVLPGVAYEDGLKLASTIHLQGSAMVWRGPREVAELYWDQLNEAQLTMAPLA